MFTVHVCTRVVSVPYPQAFRMKKHRKLVPAEGSNEEQRRLLLELRQAQEGAFRVFAFRISSAGLSCSFALLLWAMRTRQGRGFRTAACRSRAGRLSELCEEACQAK